MAHAVSARRILLAFGDVAVPVELTAERDQARARVGGREIVVTARALAEGVYAITCDGRRLVGHYASDGAAHHLQVDGNTYTFLRDRPSPRRPAAAAPHRQDLGAPMPGLVTHIFVQEGQTVAAGEPLFVVEAMKMENVVCSPAAGRVAAIRTAPGQQVEAGAIVVEVEAV